MSEDDPDMAVSALQAPSLDREAPLPLYFQLREALLREIHDRGLRPGDRLPTETELERRYRVSRSTIRQALNDLAAEGVVKRIQGKGTFVGTPRIQHVPVLTSFTELLRSQGYAPSHRLLASSTVGAPEEVASDLGLEEGAPCRFLRRLFLADGNPVGLAETWLPREVLGPGDELFEHGALEDGSLYELLEGEVGLALHRAIETVNPSVADARDGGLLRCPPGSPVLLIRRISFDRDERPVESTRLVFAGDRYEYRVEMYRPGPGGR